MFDWINSALKSMVIKNYGIEKWEEILKNAKIENQAKSDQTLLLLNSFALNSNDTKENCLEKFGVYIIKYAMENGHKNILYCLADSLENFLNGLNPLLFFLNQFKFGSKIKLPYFRYENLIDGSCTLHFYSYTHGLTLFAKGILAICIEVLFHVKPEIFIQEVEFVNQNQPYEYVIFVIKLPNKKLLSITRSKQDLVVEKPIHLSLYDFAKICPTHICFNKDMKIEHMGVFLVHELGLSSFKNIHLLDLFEIAYPNYIQMSFEKISQNLASFYVLQMKQNLTRISSENATKFLLKGQMFLVNKGENLLFLNSPYLSTACDLLQSSIFISDFALHDSTRYLIVLNQAILYYHSANEKLKEAVKCTRQKTFELELNKSRDENLLQDFLPQYIIEKRLIDNSEFAESFPEATCMIVNVAFFDVILNNCNAKEVFTMITELFLVYDRLIDRYGCHKVGSMRDSYFIVCGVPEKEKYHAAKILNLSIGFSYESKRIVVPTIDLPVVLRIAIHTGPVVAGLIGRTIRRYSIFGEGFDFARQLILLEDIPGQIIATSSTQKQASKSDKDEFLFANNGYKQVRKNHATCTFRLKKNEKKSVWEITGQQPPGSENSDGYANFFENNLDKWIELEKNLHKQLTVIALMKNKPIPANTLALRRLRWVQATKDRAVISLDSGVSVNSSSKGSNSSSTESRAFASTKPISTSCAVI